MERISISIEATAMGVDVVVTVDGNEVARQREVPTKFGCKCEGPDWHEQIGGKDNGDDLNAVAEFMEDKFSFFGMDLLQILSLYAGDDE